MSVGVMRCGRKPCLASAGFEEEGGHEPETRQPRDARKGKKMGFSLGSLSGKERSPHTLTVVH